MCGVKNRGYAATHARVTKPFQRAWLACINQRMGARTVTEGWEKCAQARPDVVDGQEFCQRNVFSGDSSTRLCMCIHGDECLACGSPECLLWYDTFDSICQALLCLYIPRDRLPFLVVTRLSQVGPQKIWFRALERGTACIR